MNGRDPRRVCRPLELWPDADRLAWDALNTQAHFLDAPAAAARWRNPTRRKLLLAWGRYLNWLEGIGALSEANMPADRITPTRVAQYIECLRLQVASRTTFSNIMSLLVLGQLFEPGKEWGWLKKIVSRLRQACRPVRDIKFCSSFELFAAGLELTIVAERRKPRLVFDQSSWFRDGLMIALLASRPLRAKNLCSIEIGRHLTWRGERYWLSFPGDEMKNYRALEFPLPKKLTASMRRYLEFHRPRLLQGNKRNNLWISNLGRAMHINSISDRIKDMTNKYVGISVNPHAFRHAAATTIAEFDPENAMIIRAILSHSSLDFSNRVYNKAANVTAATKYADHVRRQRLGPPPVR